MKIVILTNTDPRFYLLLGPFLANRAVAEAYGDKLWDDSGDIWGVALSQSEENVMGFAAFRPSKKGRSFLLCNDYVLPQFRDDQNEVQTTLLEALLAQCPEDTKVTVTAVGTEKELYEGKGFTHQGNKGSFLVMRKSPSGEQKS